MFNASMIEELIGKLAMVRGMRVTGRYTSTQYKQTAKSTTKIASELGVQYLLETFSSLNDDQVSLKVKLLDAFNDEYIWTGEYQRNIRHILGLQGIIVKEITDRIGIQPTAEEEIRISEKREVDPETYTLYIKGMYYINKKTPSDLEEGLR